ncbi:MAG TPA: hypothetical protein DCS90_13905 [Ktedonobacter sp.]|nr:hypothetical protein [Ktedonobacter sp.]
MNRHDTFSSGRALYLHVAGHSEKGRLRDHNADAFALYDLSDPRQAEQLGRLYLLADGTGSDDGGVVASHIAIETIPSVYYSHNDGVGPLSRLQQAFSDAHNRIHEFAVLHPEHAEMATTCTAVVVRGMRMWIAHIGDSRAYLVHAVSQARPTIARLTTDHSMAAS